MLITDSQIHQREKQQLQLQLPPADQQQPLTSSEIQDTTKTKKPKMYLDIEILLQLMKKYQTPDKVQLLR